MVKILRCYSFTSSSILKQAQNEPACLTAGKNYVFVGTSFSSQLEVYKRDTKVQKSGDWSKYCAFQTGAHVSQVEYNETGDYIATIERKATRQAEVVSVKVYLNWHIAAVDDQFRTRVRVAGLGYRSNNVQTGNKMEVVDVPCERGAEYMCTCQETGNLGIAYEGKVKLYHLTEKMIPNSQTTFLDVILFLQLEFTHIISYISLCEDYLVCSSADCVQVFRIEVSNDADQQKSMTRSSDATADAGNQVRPRRVSSALSSLTIQEKVSSLPSFGPAKSQRDLQVIPRFSAVGERSSSTPSPSLSVTPKSTSSDIEDDPHFIHWTFTEDTSSARSVTRSQRPDTVTLELEGLKNLGKVPRSQPTLPVIKDLRGGTHLSTGKTNITQVVYQHLGQSDMSWIHVQLLPTYITGRNETLKLDSMGVPLHSSRHSSLVSMSCLMSGRREGFMYSLEPKPLLLSTYSYSSEAIQIKTNGRMLYVLAENGLEIYTTRCQIAAIYNTEKFDNITKTCPRPDEDICMCGAQQFLGPREIALSSNHIILFNKMDNAWNINVMEEPSTADIYHDMLSFGERYQTSAPHTYHHLLLEGHMILKSSLIGQTLHQSEVSNISDLLHESSAMLGEYYASPDCASWYLCLPYYNMSGLSLIEVVRQAVQHKQHTKQTTYGKGLVQYLGYTLFTDDDPLDIKQADGDLVLEVCYDCMPERLPDIILFSRLKSFTPETAHKLLKSTSKSRPTMDSRSRTKERLAYVSLNLQLCEPDVAVSTLSSIVMNDLTATCVNNPQILQTSMTEFSPLSQLLRCRCSGVLLNILVMLYDRGTMSMDLAIKLLQGKSGVPAVHKNTHIRDYLEALVNDDCRRYSFDEAVPRLCEIYLERLSDWEPPTSRQLTPSLKFRLPQGNGHFGRRYSWLDCLPPFTGAKSITSTCKYVVPVTARRTGLQSQQVLQCQARRTGLQSQQVLQCQKTDEICSCFLCNEDLLKLQALLCYSEVSTSVCDKVLTYLSQHDLTFCHDSITILCLLRTNILQAISLVVDKHPNIAADFGTSIIKNDAKQWEYLLQGFLTKVTTADKTGISDDVTVIKEVLHEMSEQLKPDIFLCVLPGNGNYFFFLPYIRHSLDVHKSSLLKEKIIAIGEKMSG